MLYNIEYSEDAAAARASLSPEQREKTDRLLGELARNPQDGPRWSRLPLARGIEVDVDIRNADLVFFVEAIYVVSEA